MIMVSLKKFSFAMVDSVLFVLGRILVPLFAMEMIDFGMGMLFII